MALGPLLLTLGSLHSCWGQGEGSPETGLTGPGLRLGVLEALLLLKEGTRWLEEF